MLFHTFVYAAFLTVVFLAYWALRRRTWQNVLLLVASYTFYGWVHPWFCILIATSTLADYACGLGIERHPTRRKLFLCGSLVTNLGLLGAFKYFHFFVDSIAALVAPLGWSLDWVTLRIVLPVGISFYTFQTLSYTIDVYRGEMRARRNLLDFAVFVAFFPQLVAGPIERARRFLPQIEAPRSWQWRRFLSAFPLLVTGVFKKMVVADNLAGPVDRVFMLQDPSWAVLAAGSLAFTIQIFADFSAYTDIARGSARLIGFELMENFRTPYLARTLPEFWSRWHISLSTWIRDYLYIPMGGSRVSTERGRFLVLVGSMGLSGLWHGAAWTYVIWGLYHGVLMYVSRRLGYDRRWLPRHRWQAFLGWAATFFCVTFGLAIFRTRDIGWLLHALAGGRVGLEPDELAAAAILSGLVALYCSPWIVHHLLLRWFPSRVFLHNAWRWVMIGATVVYARGGAHEFIYFQF